MALIQVNWRPDERQLRTFGAIGAVALTVLGGLATWRGSLLGIQLEVATAQRVAYALWGAGALAAVLAWMAPRSLLPIYVIATAISLPIGFVISYVVLGILFYLVLTPFGLVFRLLGRDPLERRFDKASRSYWVARSPVDDVSRYYRQY